MWELVYHIEQIQKLISKKKWGNCMRKLESDKVGLRYA
jgi:hypothetical protein